METYYKTLGIDKTTCKVIMPDFREYIKQQLVEVNEFLNSQAKGPGK